MSSNAPIDPAIVERASLWMARLWADDSTERERAACEHWRAAHPDHERAWRRLEGVADQVAVVPTPAMRRVLSTPPAATRRRRNKLLLSLALLAGAVGVGVGQLQRSAALPFQASVEPGVARLRAWFDTAPCGRTLPEEHVPRNGSRQSWHDAAALLTSTVLADEARYDTWYVRHRVRCVPDASSPRDDAHGQTVVIAPTAPAEAAALPRGRRTAVRTLRVRASHPVMHRVSARSRLH